MDLTTTANVQVQLKAGGETISSTSPTLAQITDLITFYSAMFEEYMDRTALVATVTEQLDVERGQQLAGVKAWPVTSVTSVHNALDRTFDSTTLLDSDAYYMRLDRGVLTVDGQYLLPGPGVLQIVYVGGMAATAAAFILAYPDISHAMDIQISAHLQRRSKLGATSVSAGGGSVSHEGAVSLLPMVKSTLDRHRRIACG